MKLPLTPRAAALVLTGCGGGGNSSTVETSAKQEVEAGVKKAEEGVENGTAEAEAGVEEAKKKAEEAAG